MKPSVFIDHNVHVKFPWKVKIGAGTVLNRGVEIHPGLVTDASISIGERCAISPYVKFFAAGHDPDDPDLKDAGDHINVGNDVWIGAGSIILPGVTVHDNAVVGAGSVVTKDVASNTIVGGVPARKIRDRGYVKT